MKIYDVLYKKRGNDEKVRWEKIGVMIEKEDGKKSIKLDMIPIGQWDGWLTISPRIPKEKIINDWEIESDSPF